MLHGLLNYMGDGITDQEIALTGIPPDQWDYQGFNTVRSFTVDGIILATFILGLVTCALIYRLDRFKTKLCWVLYVTGAVYLVYIIVSGYNFYWTSDIWTALYGAPASWSIKLIFYEMSPLIPLLFMSLPFLLMLELVFAAVLTYLVIVPLYNDNENVWLNFKVGWCTHSPCCSCLLLTQTDASFLSLLVDKERGPDRSREPIGLGVPALLLQGQHAQLYCARAV